MHVSNAQKYETAAALAVRVEDAATEGRAEAHLLSDCANVIESLAADCEARQSDPLALGPLSTVRLNFKGIGVVVDLLRRGALGERLPADVISSASHLLRVLAEHHQWLQSQPATGNVFSQYPGLEGLACANER